MIDVNGDEAPNCRQNGTPTIDTNSRCSGSEDDFDRYIVQILANGKLRIHPEDAKAVDWATINTSIRDSL